MDARTRLKTHPLRHRPRRLRHSTRLRAAVRETALTPADFIYPMFIVHGTNVRDPIPSMPGICQLSVDQSVEEAKRAAAAGIPAVLLFGIPASKDPIGEENFDDDGIIQRAVRALKAALPDLLVVTDVCLCEYTDHGHCGVLNHENPVLPDGYVLNDETLDILARVSVSHARAGADIVAPSGMIDGMVASIREGLDEYGYDHIPIMSYAIKYASAFYGPFRDAAQGAPKFGDRRTHQMDPGNVREALREAALDVEEGRGLPDGQARPRLPRRHPPGARCTPGTADGRVQRERRVLDGEGGRRTRLAGRAFDRAREPHRDQARRRRSDHHLPRAGSGAVDRSSARGERPVGVQ